MQPQFESSVEARDFFIQKIVEQASREGARLHEIDRAMLEFSEDAYDTSQAMRDLEDKFDDHNDELERTTTEYESMVAGLVQRAFEYEADMAKRMGLESPLATWRRALDVLEREDHYISVMVTQGVGKKLRRKFLGLF